MKKVVLHHIVKSKRRQSALGKAMHYKSDENDLIGLTQASFTLYSQILERYGKNGTDEIFNCLFLWLIVFELTGNEYLIRIEFSSSAPLFSADYQILPWALRLLSDYGE